MSAEVSFTKRAAAELSRCFNGITVSRQASSKSSASSSPGTTNNNHDINGGGTVSPNKPASNNVSNHITILNNNSKSSTTTSTSTSPTTLTTTSGRKTSSSRRNSNPAQSVLDNNNPENSNNSNNNSPVHNRNNYVINDKHKSKQQQQSNCSIHKNVIHSHNAHHSSSSNNNNNANSTTTTNSPSQDSSVRLPQSSSPSPNESLLTTPSRRKPSRAGPPPKAPPKTNRARRKNYQLNLNRPRTLAELFRNQQFLQRLFSFVAPIERCTLVQVCKTWCHVLYDESRFWKNLTFVIYYNEFRQLNNMSMSSSCSSSNISWDNNGNTVPDPNSNIKSLLMEATIASGSDKPNDPLLQLQRENKLSRAQQLLQQQQQKQGDDRTDKNSRISTNNAENAVVVSNSGNKKQPTQQSPHCVNDNENGFSSILLYSNGECGGVCDQSAVTAAAANAVTSAMNGANWQGSLVGSTSPLPSMPSKGENAFYAKMLMLTAANNPTNSVTLNQIQYPTLALLDKSDFPTRLFCSLKIRRFGSICLHGAADSDLIELATQVTLNSIDSITDLCIRHSTITDKGVEVLLAALAPSLQSFELIGCNELSDSGLWTGLVPKLLSLTIQDCINISDETIAAICQLLPALSTLHIQAYHVTDASMAYFSTSMLRETLRVLVLQHCWEITNQGVANLAHSLPNLTSLSLSGCSKVTDDAIEIVAEQLRSLITLDLSWCPRISDAALEYIACDLAETLQNLVLDRCLHITDIGLGYIATMAHLEQLSVRWCPQVRDFGIQTLVSLRTLKSLSIAGCNHITITGMSFFIRMQQLHELELTNCPAASKDLIKYLCENMPKNCTIIY